MGSERAGAGLGFGEVPPRRRSTQARRRRRGSSETPGDGRFQTGEVELVQGACAAAPAHGGYSRRPATTRTANVGSHHRRGPYARLSPSVRGTVAAASLVG